MDCRSEIFLRDLVRKHGKHQIWTDGADWYKLACESMNLKHHVYLHGSWLWEVMERSVQRLKDRTESFDDLFRAGTVARNANSIIFPTGSTCSGSTISRCTNRSSQGSKTSLSKRSKFRDGRTFIPMIRELF